MASGFGCREACQRVTTLPSMSTSSARLLPIMVSRLPFAIRCGSAKALSLRRYQTTSPCASSATARPKLSSSIPPSGQRIREKNVTPGSILSGSLTETRNDGKSSGRGGVSNTNGTAAVTLPAASRALTSRRCSRPGRNPSTGTECRVPSSGDTGMVHSCSPSLTVISSAAGSLVSAETTAANGTAGFGFGAIEGVAENAGGVASPQPACQQAAATQHSTKRHRGRVMRTSYHERPGGRYGPCRFRASLDYIRLATTALRTGRD